MNSPHKWPITRKMFPFDDVIMEIENPVKPNLCRPNLNHSYQPYYRLLILIKPYCLSGGATMTISIAFYQFTIVRIYIFTFYSYVFHDLWGIWIWEYFDNITFRFCLWTPFPTVLNQYKIFPHYRALFLQYHLKLPWNLAMQCSPTLNRTLTDKSLVCLLYTIHQCVSCTHHYLLNDIFLDWTHPSAVNFWMTYFNRDDT